MVRPDRESIIKFFRLATLSFASFVPAYGVLRISGLFTAQTTTLIRVLHELSPQIALLLFIVAVVCSIALEWGVSAEKSLLYLRMGLIIMAAGLILSSFVRMEGKIILTEGQTFSGTAAEYVDSTLYLGKMARLPRFSLEAGAVSHSERTEFSFGGGDAVSASYRYGESPVRQIAVRSAFPTFSDGLRLKVVRFGYSPRYRISGQDNEVLEESFVSLGVFPPGNEDSFGVLSLPHVFYLRYYPSGIDEGSGNKDGAGVASKPQFFLRLTRNYDILFRGPVRLHEVIRFEREGISFEEVRKWVELSVVRDYGMTLFFAGCFLVSISLVIRYRPGEKSAAANRAPTGGHQL